MGVMGALRNEGNTEVGALSITSTHPLSEINQGMAGGLQQNRAFIWYAVETEFTIRRIKLDSLTSESLHLLTESLKR